MLGLGFKTGPTEYSDKGFTLVEVIIAVVIMAIAAIPILHAFSTTANTSARALVKMRATNAAENIMEDIKGRSLEEVVETYGDPSVTYPNFAGLNTIDPDADPGKGYVPRKDEDGNTVLAGYKFELSTKSSKYNSDINDAIDRGYVATIEIDPTYYPNINSVNLSDFDEVSSAHSAIISVDESLDEQAVNKFVDLNSHMESLYVIPGAKSKFEKEFKREIRVDVTKKGEPVDIDGETVYPAEVAVTVSYLLFNNGLNKYVPTGYETQKIISNRKVFNNATNNNMLNSIFVMYNPLYENANDLRDIIIVHNDDSIPFNLFVVAQNTNKNKDAWEDYRKKATGGLILEIYEKEVDGKQPVTLYTNVHEDVDYQRQTTSTMKAAQCYINLADPWQSPESITDKFDDLIYKRAINKKGKWQKDDTKFTEALNTRDIDGKFLDASRVEDKIFDVRVTVEKTEEKGKSKSDTEDTGSWPTRVTLTGTLVDE